MLTRSSWWLGLLGFAFGLLSRRILPKTWPSWYELIIVGGVGLAVFVFDRARRSSRQARDRS